MSTTTSFESWIARIRAGDADAATELVRQYERAVRVAVRVKLTDPRLRTHFDSMDVCQSVLASFFVRAAAGQFDLQSPEQLVGLLVKMARNKLLMQVRHHRQQQRDVDRNAADNGDAPTLADHGPGPVREASARELLQTVLDRLTPAERDLALRRGQGDEWVQIAAEQGEAPNTVRMRLSRAIDRVAAELGLTDTFDWDGDG